MRQFSVTVLLSGWVVLAVLPASDANAFCVRRFGGLHCDDEGHDEITKQSLDFLSEGLVDLIVDKNTDQDFDAASDMPERHATNCMFSEMVSYINERYAASIAALDPAAPDSGVAATHFGLLLHPIQDFYSHSAWVDPPPIGLGLGAGGRLLQSGLAAWELPAPYQKLFAEEDVVLVEGLPPAGASIDLPRDGSGFPTSVVPIVSIGGTVFRGLMTSSASPLDGGKGQCPQDDHSLPGDGQGDCTDPESVCIRHGGLGGLFQPAPCQGELYEDCFHHDKPFKAHYADAFAAAVGQTEHEWCRLLHSIKGPSDDFARASVPMALWVHRDDQLQATPHPVGTACERDLGGPIEVNVKIASVAGEVFAGDLDPFSLYNLSLVAYTGDFRHSARRTVSGLVGTDPELPEDGVNLCLKTSDTLVATVWGWKESLVNLFDPLQEYDFSDEAIRGVTLAFTSTSDFGAGTVHASSPDLEDVAFEISLVVVDTDSDGLSRCGEAAFQTDPANPDTDGDGLLDGEEVDIHGTDPADSDSDGDDLDDGIELGGANPTNPVDADSDDDALPDGTEDADRDGALDPGETDPNDFDSDDDLLGDGCEISGANSTDPLVADSDLDELLDGAEDTSGNCAVDSGETDPNDADSDDDTLGDGFEVGHGSDPLDTDSDDDGIPDADDVEWIQHAIGELPETAFVGLGQRAAMLAQLDAIEKLVGEGKVDQALKELGLLRHHVEGCGSVAAPTDWIANCATQLEVRELLDLLVSNLGS